MKSLKCNFIQYYIVPKDIVTFADFFNSWDFLVLTINLS